MPISVSEYQRVMRSMQIEESVHANGSCVAENKAIGYLQVGVVLLLATIITVAFQGVDGHFTWTPLILGGVTTVAFVVSSLFFKVSVQGKARAEQLRENQKFLTKHFNLVNSESDQQRLESILKKYTAPSNGCAEKPDAQCAHRPPCMTLEGR